MAKALIDLVKKNFPDAVLESHSLSGDDTIVVDAQKGKAVHRF